MYLSQMLFSHVTPLSEYQPMREEKKKLHKMEYEITINVRRHSDTIDKYRAAWKEGEVWLSTMEIERRLGMTKTSCANTLKRWLTDYNLLERRPIGKKYNPKVGYEWRWCNR